MKIVNYSSTVELAELKSVWERLGEDGIYFVPSFSELRHRLETSGSKFRLLAAVDDAQKVIALACFTYEVAMKDYRIGKIKLFHLQVRVARLFGSCVVGQACEIVIQEFFHLVLKEGGFDLIDVGHIFVDSPLYKAITNLRSVIVWRTARKERFWWFVRLPVTFNEYLASLRDKTRTHLTRDSRRFERAAPEFRVMQRPDEVNTFLQDAERISRLTYQWPLTFGICNDEGTRRYLMRLAKNGVLRCYISYLHGEPCAFGWGELSHRKFSFRQTGYNPRYRKLTPGTALIMSMVRDLIENTNCEVFDLQWGDKGGYKSRFGTVSLRCTALHAAHIYKPRSLLIVSFDRTLNLAKNAVGLVLERGPFKARWRSALRRHGVGTF
jgi:hypothetical protein